MSVKYCCKQPNNLIEASWLKRLVVFKAWPTDARTLYVCKLCGCRHFRVKAKPGDFRMLQG